MNALLIVSLGLNVLGLMILSWITGLVNMNNWMHKAMEKEKENVVESED